MRHDTRKLFVLNALGISVVLATTAYSQNYVRPPLNGAHLTPQTSNAKTAIVVTLLVPVQLRNLPSDFTNVAVKCFINAPSKHWEGSSPVHVGAGSYIGTISVKFTLSEQLPYDARYSCGLYQGNTVIDTLEGMRNLHPDPAFPKMLGVDGRFQ